MADEQRRTDPGDTFREGVRAVTGILGAFKDAFEQTLNELSERGDIAPDKARDAARDAMKRAQDAMEDVRGRIDFVTRREFDSLKAELDELRSQVERHATHGAHHHHGAGEQGNPGATGQGAAGSSMGDGSPGL
jgi:polyhydroxyalkanoate synthesis regulator phasin